jgi:hypothetical protein
VAQRRHHYESAFEHHLRERRVPYVAVNEARKALLPEDARPALIPPGGGRPKALKSFDFVLYGAMTNLLVEIKGRRIARRVSSSGGGRGRLESWVTEEDVFSLGSWARLFGGGFSAAFVFVYWCDEMPPASLFEEHFEFRGRWYAVRAILLEEYTRAMKPRSARWRTVHLAARDFDRLSTTLCGADPRSAGALQSDVVPVASW